MKYISLQSFEDVTAALNFVGEGIRVVGGCELYTCKAAGDDRKLYKQIDRSLESQLEDLLRIGARLNPPEAKLFARSSNLSQASPFGPLSRPASRKTYAYLIVTLNASHPDYDFSHVLRPSDFERERSIDKVMPDVDSKVYGARSTTGPRGARAPDGTPLWGPGMWKMIDAEMNLHKCEIYSYKPEENPFEDEELSLWSHHYFFYNKALKRVCYFYLRALSPTWYGDDEEDDVTGTITPLRPKRSYSARQSIDFSARKRARYWLGDRADDLEDEDDWGTQALYDDDEVDVDVELLDEIVKRGRSMSNESALTIEDEPESGKGSKASKKGKSNCKSANVAEVIAL